MACNTIKISRVSPATNVMDPLILPLTFFDLFWLKEMPMKRLTFYRLTETSCDAFYSVILPKLEQSLSLVLAHFLPLCGNLRWNPEDPKPHIVISPQDALCLTVAETDADFSRVSGKGLCHENELHALVTDLPVFSDSASLLSLQITLFPNQGFCIGTTMHHAAMDGKTLVKFLKSWAHLCKYGTIREDLDLPMLLDRTVINVPAQLESKVLELFPYDVRTLKLHYFKENGDDAIKTTLELTQENVKKLRERAKSESTRSDLHLSTFVLSYAYVLTCVVKARRVDAEQLVPFTYSADFRDRLDPPVPVNYFGNCVLPINFNGYKAETFLGENGFINCVEILSDSVRGLSSRGAEIIWDLYEEGLKEMEPCLSVTGSNKFGIYGSDFGWGKPVLTENITISRDLLFSMSERRDETGGVEIGICLKKCEIDVFISLFQNGLDN